MAGKIGIQISTHQETRLKDSTTVTGALMFMIRVLALLQETQELLITQAMDIFRLLEKTYGRR